jgi:signal transduction histidine kinase
MATPRLDRLIRSPRLLASMRIRLKLVFLHTCFSIALAGILVLALRPAIAEVVKQAEAHEAQVVLRSLLAAEGAHGPGAFGPGVTIVRGDADRLGLDPALGAKLAAGEPTVSVPGDAGAAPMVVGRAPGGELVGVTVVLQGARDAVVRLYVLMTIALLAVYALVAAALELFVLPQHVYGPIRTMLEAELALQEGRREAEIIPDAAIPGDELGEIMRSRNRSVVALRQHEADLARALKQLEEIATDLKRKNHLLEMARRNMADADRLASLGLMSAGIAHELNTPLAVIKGLVEKLNRSMAGANGHGAAGTPVSTAEAALMLRVVGRLERLSESLLDFARVRPPTSSVVALRPLVDEAWTLVRLDREARAVELVNDVPEDVRAWCDADRIVQVLVNLLRNAVDAMTAPPAAGAAGAARDRRAPLTIVITGAESSRGPAGEQAPAGEAAPSWATLTITDNGPGIDPELLSRLFQPFVSTRLDAKGTGLGLAVAEGIVREHGGVVLARNRTDGVPGAVFEIVLPEGPTSGPAAPAPGAAPGAPGEVDSAAAPLPAPPPDPSIASA